MKYICEHYIPGDSVENRAFTLSAVDKVDYIISAFTRNNIKIELISASRSTNEDGYYKERTDKISDMCKIISSPTFGTKSMIGKKIQRIYMLFWLTIFLLKNCKKGEWVAVYHSIFTVLPMLIVKKIKKIKIINEVEELFYELDTNTSNCRKKLELKIIKESDSFIFASKQLNDKCNSIIKKPYVIANGSYNSVPKRIYKKNKKIRLIYAGLISLGKVAFKTVEIANYLTSDYELCIIGYGDQNSIYELQKLINKVNIKSECKVFFDGIKRGVDYEAYLQNCSIGLCPLTTDSLFQSACFPSKITSYIANGLHVVTTFNKTIAESPYKDVVSFVKNQSPKEFATTIMQLKTASLRDTRELIKELDLEFVDMVKKRLISTINKIDLYSKNKE